MLSWCELKIDVIIGWGLGGAKVSSYLLGVPNFRKPPCALTKPCRSVNDPGGGVGGVAVSFAKVLPPLCFGVVGLPNSRIAPPCVQIGRYWAG